MVCLHYSFQRGGKFLCIYAGRQFVEGGQLVITSTAVKSLACEENTQLRLGKWISAHVQLYCIFYKYNEYQQQKKGEVTLHAPLP
jgi:hypothetical protein